MYNAKGVAIVMAAEVLDILEKHNFRLTVLHQSHDVPENVSSIILKSFSVSSHGERLARKTARKDRQALWELVAGKLPNISFSQCVLVICPVSLRGVLVYLIGKYGSKSRPLEPKFDPPDSREETGNS